MLRDTMIGGVERAHGAITCCVRDELHRAFALRDGESPGIEKPKAHTISTGSNTRSTL